MKGLLSRPRLVAVITLAVLAFTLAVYISDFYSAQTASFTVINATPDHYNVSRAFISTTPGKQRPVTLAQSILDKRALAWNQAIVKGKGNFKTMAAADTPNCQPVAQWTDYADLPKYGWSKFPDEASNTVENYDYLLASLIPNTIALSQAWPVGLNLRLPQALNKIVTWVHQKASTVTPPGSDVPVVYMGTGASYINIFNTADGVITTGENTGPDAAVRARRNPRFAGPVVPLKQWSDVVYLEWINQCSLASRSPSRLNYIIRSSVTGTDIISTVFRASNDGNPVVAGVLPAVAPPVWTQKLRFSRPDDEDELEFGNSDIFFALLGTPHGSGVSWFLAQHAPRLGHKIVKSITVFGAPWQNRPERADPTISQPTLIFELETIPGMLSALDGWMNDAGLGQLLGELHT